MTILQISILAVVALVLGRLPKGRQLALLAVSTFVIFWLQPAEPFVSLVFWLPVATLDHHRIGMGIDFRTRNARLETKLARHRNFGWYRFIDGLEPPL